MDYLYASPTKKPGTSRRASAEIHSDRFISLRRSLGKDELSSPLKQISDQKTRHSMLDKLSDREVCSIAECHSEKDAYQSLIESSLRIPFRNDFQESTRSSRDSLLLFRHTSATGSVSSTNSDMNPWNPLFCGGENFLQHKKQVVPEQPTLYYSFPDIINDFYSSPIDWNTDDKLLIAAESDAYLYNASQNDKYIDNVATLLPEEGNFSLGIFNKMPERSNEMVLASTQGMVYHYDISQSNSTQINKFETTDEKVPSGYLYGDILFLGGYDGCVRIFDMRLPADETLVAMSDSHEGPVVGISPRSNGIHLATGCDEGYLNLWDLRAMDEPFQKIRAYSLAALKAISWCREPKSDYILTGGGKKESFIRMWNIHNGKRVEDIYVASQITNLFWSEDGRQLLACHGFRENHQAEPKMNLWNYENDSFSYAGGFWKGNFRIVGSALSHDKEHVAALGDDTFTVWKVFGNNCSMSSKSSRRSSLLTTDDMHIH